jgi:hypothetical protein
VASFPIQQAETSGIVLRTAPAGALRKALCLWHLCSLDAPTVAIVWAGAFAWAAHMRVASWWWAAMACAVWAVYVGDRLLDVRSGRHDLQPRHTFHWNWRRVLTPAAVGSAGAAAWLVLAHLPARALGRDSMVAAAALAYFSGVHGRPKTPNWLKKLVSRELVVGVVFTAGCALPEFSAHGFARHWPELAGALALPLVYFAALAWLNVRSITWWEGESRDRIRPYAAAAGLAAAGLVTAFAVAGAQPRAALILVAGAASALLLAALDRLPMDETVRRSAADFVLLTPLLCLPLAGMVR